MLDCPDACSLEITVRAGRVAEVGPTEGDFICSKVTRFPKRIYHSERLHTPLRRVGAKGDGAFAAISWDEAIEEITARLRDVRDTYGGEAILPFHYGGSNGFLTDELVDHAYFQRLGASRLEKTICAAPTSAVALGMYGKMAGVSFTDYPEADFILIWGANPRASNIHLVPYLEQARLRGAFIALVDPIRTLSTRLVDLHLPVYPGSDLPLALSMIDHWAKRNALDREFIERWASGVDGLLDAASAWTLERAATEARVDVEAVRLLADRYASATKAILRCGWGLERNRNGGHAVAAILAMPCLLGKFGARGSGYTLSNSGAGRLQSTRIWDSSKWTSRRINMTELARVLGAPLTPPVKALFVYNCNPVATVPDQNGVVRGLEQEDLFTVVFDQVMTDTARYADIVLPATTFFEHHDVKRSYGRYVVGATRPLIDAIGEARSNASVFQALGRAMGFEDAIFHWSEETLREKVVGAIELNGRPAPAERLLDGQPLAYDFDGSSPIQFGNVFPKTADGRVDLLPACLGKEPYRYHHIRSEPYPLALITPASGKTTNSTFGEFNLNELRLTIHPEDARSRGISDGDRLRVFNELGEVECRALVDARMREGVVHLPKGAWMKASLNRRTGNALTPAHVSDVGGGACFNDARVEVEKL